MYEASQKYSNINFNLDAALFGLKKLPSVDFVELRASPTAKEILCPKGVPNTRIPKGCLQGQAVSAGNRSWSPAQERRKTFRQSLTRVQAAQFSCRIIREQRASAKQNYCEMCAGN